MNTSIKTIKALQLLILATGLICAPLLDFDLFEILLPTVGAYTILNLIFLTYLFRLEKSRNIEYYEAKKPVGVWPIYLILLVVLVILQIFEPADIKGLTFILFLSNQLLDELHPKFRWVLALDGEELVFPNLWQKNISLSEIDGAEFHEKGLLIKLGESTKVLKVDQKSSTKLLNKMKF